MNTNLKNISKSLYSLFRPTAFDMVIGQQNVVKFLTNSLQKGIFPNFLIFYGSYGVGKTTLARLYAKSVNCLKYTCSNKLPCCDCSCCENSLSYLNEFNSSNYALADNIRDLIEDAQYMPHFGKYKFYILDEFHMMSTKAFNILLKEVEEPMEHVRFIAITTNIEAIPKALVSRSIALRFELFNKVDMETLRDRLIQISEENSLNINKHQISSAIEFNSMFLSPREVVNTFIRNIIHPGPEQAPLEVEKYLNNLLLPSDLSAEEKIKQVGEIFNNLVDIDELFGAGLKHITKKIVYCSDKEEVERKMYFAAADEILKFMDYKMKNSTSVFLLILKLHVIYGGKN